jgi:DNA-binding transcriptional MerR regulator
VHGRRQPDDHRAAGQPGRHGHLHRAHAPDQGPAAPAGSPGRIGYHGQGHLSRLRLIADLHEQGFSLASIKRLTQARQSGRSLEDVLRLQTQVAPVWAREEPVRLGLREFREHFPGQKVTPAVITRAIRTGLISVDGTSVVVRNPGVLRTGPELARQGIPAAEALDELQALQAAADSIAERFTRVLERHMWHDFVQAGMPSEQIAPLTEALSPLSALAEDFTALVLREHCAARRVRRSVADQRQLPKLASQPCSEASGLVAELTHRF